MKSIYITLFFCGGNHFLMTASVLIHLISCVNQFPASVTRNLMFSVSLGFRKIKLSDLPYRLVVVWPLFGMQDAGRIKSDKTWLETGCFFYLFAYLFLAFLLFINSRQFLFNCKITKNIIHCNRDIDNFLILLQPLS